MKKKQTPLEYWYDRDADVFYFSQGAPSPRDDVIEAGEDVVLRISPRTGVVRGFTLLNASKRGNIKTPSIPLPFSLVATK